MPFLPITTKNSTFLFLNFFLAAACVLRAVHCPAPRPSSSAPSRSATKKGMPLGFLLFVSLAQTTPAQQAGGTSPSSVGLLVRCLHRQQSKAQNRTPSHCFDGRGKWHTSNSAKPPSRPPFVGGFRRSARLLRSGVLPAQFKRKKNNAAQTTTRQIRTSSIEY